MKVPRFVRSLVFKISFAILVMETAVFVMLGYYYINRYSREIDKRIHSNMQIPGVLMADQALNYDAVRDRDAIERLVGERVIRAFIVRADKGIFYASDSSLEGRSVATILGEEVAREFDPRMGDSRIRQVTHNGSADVCIVTPLRPGDKLIGYVYIEVDMMRAAAEKRATAVGFFLSSALCILLTTLTEVFLVHTLTGPRISKTVRCLRQVEAGNLRARLTSKAWSDELGELQQSVNAMIAQVERRTEERRAAEAALRTSERRFREMFETMTEAVALFEIIYDEQGTAIDYVVLNVNPAHERIEGVARTAVVGRRASELCGRTPPDLELYARVAATGQPHEFERHDEQQNRDFAVSVFSPGEGRFTTVAQDITERRRAERLERAKREADAASAELVGSPLPLMRALEKLAAASGSPRSTRYWRHYSVAERVAYLARFGFDKEALKEYHSYVRLVKGVAVVIVLLLAVSLGRKDELWFSQGLEAKERELIEHLEENPHEHEKWAQLGQVQMNLGKYPQAWESFEKAKKTHGRFYPDGYLGLAEISMRSDSGEYFSYKKAVEFAEEAVQRCERPEHRKKLIYALTLLAKAARHAENHDLAVRSLRKALERDPNNKELAERLKVARAAAKRGGKEAKPPKGSPQSETSSD